MAFNHFFSQSQSAMNKYTNEQIKKLSLLTFACTALPPPHRHPPDGNSSTPRESPWDFPQSSDTPPLQSSPPHPRAHPHPSSPSPSFPFLPSHSDHSQTRPVTR